MTSAGQTARPVFLTAQWRHLLMLNWPVDAETLAPYLPAGTELDTWEGRPYVSLVGFMFFDTRLKGIPIPFHRNFEEINLRFYVRRHEAGECRRGVVFIREIVPRRAVGWIANTIYDEHYLIARMTHQTDEGHVAYTAENAVGNLQFSVRYESVPAPLQPGSSEEFFAEHYWGYTRKRNGRTNEYRVDHPSWDVLPVANATVQGSPAAFYGEAFAGILGDAPASAFLADGSEVAVRGARRLK